MPTAITDDGPFYADFRIDAHRSRLIGVREHARAERDRRDSHLRQGYGGQAR